MSMHLRELAKELNRNIWTVRRWCAELGIPTNNNRLDYEDEVRLREKSAQARRRNCSMKIDGALIKRVYTWINDRKLSQTEAAGLIGISSSGLSRFLREKSASSALRFKIKKFMDNLDTPETLLNPRPSRQPKRTRPQEDIDHNDIDEETDMTLRNVAAYIENLENENERLKVQIETLNGVIATLSGRG